MSNIFIRFPNITGNVSSKNHQGWVALNYLSFGGNLPVSTKVGRVTDRSGSTTQFSDVFLTKKLDNATVPLFQNFCSHQVMDAVEIDVCHSSDGLTPYAKYKLSDVVITHHQHTVTADSTPTEELQLNFSKIEMTYINHDKTNASKSPMTMGFDLENAALM